MNEEELELRIDLAEKLVPHHNKEIVDMIILDIAENLTKCYEGRFDPDKMLELEKRYQDLIDYAKSY